MSTLHILQSILPLLRDSAFVRIGSMCRSLYSIAQIYMKQKRRESLIEIERTIKLEKERYTILPNGKQEGLYEYFYDDIIRLRINCINGKKEGLCEHFYNDSVTRTRCTYVNDKREGLYESFYTSGIIHERYTYVNNMISGLYEEFYRNGNMLDRYTYINGVVIE